ncbi:MAG: hypothetical protein LBP19_02370 [Treponema sp.]|jgi:hypothetical protein|nr:hypothetical protein [Treponema sp.]
MRTPLYIYFGLRPKPAVGGKPVDTAALAAGGAGSEPGVDEAGNTLKPLL